MARRMQQPKEYYWQGKGGLVVTLGKIISELLGRDFDKYTTAPATGDPTDVYTLQFDCYNDSSSYEGHSIIHVPHNEDIEIVFTMIILSEGTVIKINKDAELVNARIPGIEDSEFAIYLRKIASNQPHRFDWS